MPACVQWFGQRLEFCGAWKLNDGETIAMLLLLVATRTSNGRWESCPQIFFTLSRHIKPLLIDLLREICENNPTRFFLTHIWYRSISVQSGEWLCNVSGFGLTVNVSIRNGNCPLPSVEPAVYLESFGYTRGGDWVIPRGGAFGHNTPELNFTDLLLVNVPQKYSHTARSPHFSWILCDEWNVIYVTCSLVRASQHWPTEWRQVH